MDNRQPDSVSDKILGKIKQEGIRPEASWKFTARKTLVWTGIVFAGILAGISLSLIMFSIFSIDQEILHFTPKRLFSPAVFRSLPFLWIGFLLIFVALAVREYHETGHGYRHRTLFVALSTLGVVVMIGTALHLLRIGERSDTALRNALPPYAEIIRPREEFWRHPEDGFATGTISEVVDSGFLLESPDGDALDVRIENDTVVKPSVTIEKGRTVHVIGVQEAPGWIDAEEILPAAPQRLGGEEIEHGFNDDRPLPIHLDGPGARFQN
ncbi:MAG: hypothetical protein WCL23_00295 [Candidatus Moraniibacteriota bacterium]